METYRYVLETEKRALKIILGEPVSDPTWSRYMNNGDTATNLSTHIKALRSEVARLRHRTYWKNETLC